MQQLFFASIVLLTLASCASVESAMDGTVKREQVALTGCSHPSGWCQEIRDTAEEAYIYAQMASNTYNDGKMFELPPGYTNPTNEGNDAIGFAYSVFEKRTNGTLDSVIISYRGTEGFDWADWWHGNIRKQQNARGLDVFDTVKGNTPPGVNMVVISHSLGGGIALEVSLKREHVDAYVFNTSPRFTADGYDIENKRVSIVENGEILKALRGPSREATQKYTSIGCSSGGPLTQHEQAKLATCLTQIAATQSDAAKASLVRNNIQRYFSGL